MQPLLFSIVHHTPTNQCYAVPMIELEEGMIAFVEGNEYDYSILSITHFNNLDKLDLSMIGLEKYKEYVNANANNYFIASVINAFSALEYMYMSSLTREQEIENSYHILMSFAGVVREIMQQYKNVRIVHNYSGKIVYSILAALGLIEYYPTLMEALVEVLEDVENEDGTINVEKLEEYKPKNIHLEDKIVISEPKDDAESDDLFKSEESFFNGLVF